MPKVLIILWTYSNRLIANQARMNDIVRYSITQDDNWQIQVVTVQFDISPSTPVPPIDPDPGLSGKQRYINNLRKLLCYASDYDVAHLTYLDTHVLPYILLSTRTPLLIGPNMGKYRNPESFQREARQRIFEMDGNRELKWRVGNRLMQAYLGVSRVMPNPTWYVGFSSWDIRTGLEARSIPKSKISLLPLGVPKDVFYPEEGNHDISGKLLFIGTESTYKLKGLGILLEALEEVVEEYPGLSLTIAGLHSSEIPSWEIPDGLRKKIEFTGYVNRDVLVDYYRRSDVYIHPSFSEAGSTTFAEALACGTPVIASDDESFREGAKGDNTIFFDIGDSKSLATKIRDFYDEPYRYIESAKKLAPEYDISRSYGALLEVYQRLMN